MTASWPRSSRDIAAVSSRGATTTLMPARRNASHRPFSEGLLITVTTVTVCPLWTARGARRLPMKPDPPVMKIRMRLSVLLFWRAGKIPPQVPLDQIPLGGPPLRRPAELIPEQCLQLVQGCLARVPRRTQLGPAKYDVTHSQCH